MLPNHKVSYSIVLVFVFCVFLLACDSVGHKKKAALIDSIVNKTSWVYDVLLTKNKP